MNRKSYLFGRYTAICLTAILAAATASARTVYDAGKAFNEAGHNTYSFGVWTLLRASGEGLGSVKNFETYASASGDFKGISGLSSGASPWIRVNTGATSVQSDEDVLTNELLVHPANPSGGTESYPSDVVRFTAPEAGWYSANIFAHDTAKEGSNASTTNSGVQVSVRAQGKVLVRQIVSLEDCATNNPTHRFDFQMPVRHLAAGDKIEVVIGNKYNAWSAHSSDATGLRFTVTKEDEGTFYDSGIAMTNCVAQTATYANPYGTIKDGSWYYLKTTGPVSGVDFAEWAPENFGHNTASRIATAGTRSATGLRGFGSSASAQSPYVVVSERADVSNDNTAPCELQAHPNGSNVREWATIRFRPPVSGYFSGSIVARDLNRGTSDHNGVDVYLLVSERVVASAYISAETFSATTRLTFDARLMAAGEPVDIVVSSHGQANNDATAVSAIIRREEGNVYDAGKSYYNEHQSGRCSNYFSDTLDGNAKWLLASKADPWDEAHSVLGTYLNPSGDKLTWWVHAVNNSNNGTAPRFAMATNGIASIDSLYIANALLLATTPYELVAQTQNPGSDNYNVSLRAEVPSNGIYRVRSYARDLNNNTTDGDGVRVILSSKSYTPASAIVSRDSNEYPYEAALAADRLWLKQGEALYFTVDPRSGSTSDATALSACYVKESDATDAPGVINIDITGSDDNYVGVGREGWSSWTKWNGIRFSSKLPAVAEKTKQNCREADGTTKRNVAFTLKRDSNANIDKGWSPTGYTGPTLLRIWAKSTGPSDTYTFTLSKLKKNEPYTLYLYSSKGMDASGNAVDGNAVFTVGGVTKSADEMWNLRDAMVLTRFEVVSDANGKISGTFAAGDADTSALAESLQGGAFNGLTIVGEFPEYYPPGLVMIIK